MYICSADEQKTLNQSLQYRTRFAS